MKITKIKPSDTKKIKGMKKQSETLNDCMLKVSLAITSLKDAMFDIASKGDKLLVGENAVINVDCTELISFSNEEDKLHYYISQIKLILVKSKEYEMASEIRDIELRLKKKMETKLKSKKK